MNMDKQVSLGGIKSLGICPRVVWLDCMVDLFSVF